MFNFFRPVDSELDEKFKKLLKLYWLRPENALITTSKSETFKDFKFESPSLDLSCGDGLFMFLHLGGEFDDDFDYFQATRSNEFKHSKIIDIYDYCDDSYEVKVIKYPEIQIDYGTDLKKGLLAKAEKTKLYKNLIQHDNNDIPLPFSDNFFKTIYSNSVYFVKNQEALLSDIYRILQPGGLAVIATITPHMHETFDQLRSWLPRDALDILERGERTLMPGMRKYNEWKEVILKVGFEIVEVRMVYPNKLLLDMWNVGFRPISHLLIRMAQSLPKEKLHETKKEWVEIFYTLLKPFLHLPQTCTLENEPYLYWVLKK